MSACGHDLCWNVVAARKFVAVDGVCKRVSPDSVSDVVRKVVRKLVAA